MKNLARAVRGTEEWSAIRQQGGCASSLVVLFTDVGAIHNEPPMPFVFPKAEIVIVDTCGKQFVSRYLHRRQFPALNKLFLNSHPYDDWTIMRLAMWRTSGGGGVDEASKDAPNEVIDVFLHERWSETVCRYGMDPKNFSRISAAGFESVISVLND